MPVGPSHASSSRARNSSSGSSFGSSFSYGGGSSYGSHRRPRTPRTFFWFGRPVVFSVGVQNTLTSLLAGLLLMLFFVGFGVFGWVGNSNKYSSNIKGMEQCVSDAEEYSYLIEHGTKTTATFTNYYYNDYTEEDFAGTGAFLYQDFNGYSYYFIKYEFTDNNGIARKGQTYTQFTTSQLDALNGQIEIAYEIKNGECISMNTNYSLQVNQDYNYLKYQSEDLLNQIQIDKIMVTLSGVVAGILLIATIIVLTRTIKKAKREDAVEAKKDEYEILEAKAKAEQEQAEANKKNRVCAYCGNRVPDSAEKCPSCGSRTFVNKKK